MRRRGKTRRKTGHQLIEIARQFCGLLDAVAGSHPACSIVALRRGSARVARMTCAELGFGSCAKQLSCGFSYCLGALGSCVVVGRTALGTLRAALLVPTVSVCVCVCLKFASQNIGKCSQFRYLQRATCLVSCCLRLRCVCARASQCHGVRACVYV